VFNDRRTRYDDKLFAVLLLLPAVFAGVRYFESKSQMEQIAALHNKAPTMVLAKTQAQASASWAATNTSIVHRF